MVCCSDLANPNPYPGAAVNKTLVFSLIIVALAFFSASASAQVSPISDIQTGAFAVGSEVTVSGIVNLVYPPYDYGTPARWHMTFFLADASGATNGICVYASEWGPRIGDQVTLTGTVAVSNGQTRIADPTAFTVDSSGNTPYAAVTITAAQVAEEQYEGCLVKIEGVTVSNENTGSGRWQVNNVDGTVTIDDELDYNYFPHNGDGFDSVTGIVERDTSKSPNQWLQPRYTADLIAAADILPHYSLYGTVVTMDDARSVHDGYYVTVRGDLIEEVGAARPAGVDVIDTGGLIFPALINNHDHPSKGIWAPIPFPRMGQFCCLADWAGSIADPYTAQMYDDFQFQAEGEITSSLTDAYAIAKIGEVRMASSGTVVTQGQGKSTSHWNDKLTKLGVGIIDGQRFPGRSVDVVFAYSQGPAFWAARHQEAEKGTLDRYFIHLAQSRTEASDGCEWHEWPAWASWSAFDGRDVIIHGNSLRGADFANWSAHPDGRQTHLSWVCYCNILYYGQTADIPSALAYGANVTIGSDATAWGKPNLLAELNYCKYFSDQSGWSIGTLEFIDMVTRNPAKSFGRIHDMGTVEEGKMANLMVIDNVTGNPYDDLLMVAGGGADPDYDCGPKDVRLTVCAGRPLYGDSDLLNTSNFPFLWEEYVEDLTICGVTKKLSIARHNSPNLEGVGDTFSKFYLEWWGKYCGSGRYPSDFVSVDPAGVLPPTPVLTPTPPPGTYIVTTWRDDAQQHISYYDPYAKYGYLHIGRHTVSDGYDGGFRFNDIQVPPGRVIRDARLVLTQYTSMNTAEPVVQVAAHDADDSPVFFFQSEGPLYRPLTTARVDWTVPPAATNDELTSPDISSVIQAIVDRPGWEEGNSVTIIVAANEPAVDHRRRIWGWSGDKTKVARLVIDADPTPVPVPTAVICTRVDEGFNGFTAPDYPVPAGWTFSGVGAGDVYTTAGDYGYLPPSLKFDTNGDEISSPVFNNPGEWLQFWVKGQGVDATSSLLIEEEYYAGWKEVVTIRPIPAGGRLYTGISLEPTTTKVRFTYQKSSGDLALDDVLVKCFYTPTPGEPTPTPTAPLPTTPTPVPPVKTPTPVPPVKTPTPVPPATPAAPWIYDYNGDGTSDIAVFRPSSGLWAVRGITRAYFGGVNDIPVPGDYTGDGFTDIAVFRESSGLWALKEGLRVYFGTAGDIPIPGDYNADGTADVGVYRESSGLWAVRGVTRTYFGGGADIPVPGYYSQDGEKAIGIFRPASGLWAVRGLTRAYFGSEQDNPVPGAYGGAGIWSPAIFRPASGLWAVRAVTRLYFGGSSDDPMPGVYQGDGTDYPGIFRGSTGLWAVKGLTRVYFGSGTDLPVTR